MGLEGAVAGTPGGVGLSAASARATTADQGSERGTQVRIARLILEHGPGTAAGLSARVGLTPAAIRRHLDSLLADGMSEAREARHHGSWGRSRPARLFAITDPGRGAFEHAYDELATSALRFLAETAGPGAVAGFARSKIADLENRYRPAVSSAPAAEQVKVLADPASAGEHHCPVADVAAGHPQLCEGETEASGRLLGTPVQRLATIARGDGICTMHVTAPSLAHTRNTTAGTAAGTTATESGGISA
jgi:predicted ArsR family transcriptional regulator